MVTTTLNTRGIAGRVRVVLPVAEVELLRQLALFSEADAHLLRTVIPRLMPLADDMLEVLMGLWAALARDQPDSRDTLPEPPALQAVFGDWLRMLGRRPAGSGWPLPPEVAQWGASVLRSPEVLSAAVVGAISPLIQAAGPFLAQAALDADELLRLQGAWRRAMVLQAALWVRVLTSEMPEYPRAAS